MEDERRDEESVSRLRHTLSIRSQLRAGFCKLSLASLAVFAPTPHSAVSADGGAPKSLHLLLQVSGRSCMDHDIERFE